MKIIQTLLDGRFAPIEYISVQDQKLTTHDIDDLLLSSNTTSPHLGIAPAYTQAGNLAAIAIATKTRAILILFGQRKGSVTLHPGLRYLESSVLVNPDRRLMTFSAYEVALCLHRCVGLKVANCIDLLSIGDKDRDLRRIVTFLFDGTSVDVEPHQETIAEAFESNIWDSGKESGRSLSHSLVEKAWLAHIIGDVGCTHVAHIPEVRTVGRKTEELDVLAGALKNSLSLYNMQPSHVSHAISEEWSTKSGMLVGKSVQFQNRVRRTTGQVQLELEGSGGSYSVNASTTSVNGKDFKLSLPLEYSNLERKKIKALSSSGGSSASQAEKAQYSVLLRALQKKTGQSMADNVWISRIFGLSIQDAHGLSDSAIDSATIATNNDMMCSPTSQDSNVPLIEVDGWVEESNIKFEAYDPWPVTTAPVVSPPCQPEMSSIDNALATLSYSKNAESSWPNVGITSDFDPWETPETSNLQSSITLSHPFPTLSDLDSLNDSQRHAVQDMLDLKKPISVIQGPPGTGKTTVITAMLRVLIAESHHCAWIVAASNIALKNVAEKLHRLGIVGWKLIVSSEFFTEWHEDLYQSSLQEYIILSTQFTKLSPLTNCRFILSTLDMLCNKQLLHCKHVKAIPMDILMVDEASQISVDRYLPALNQFGSQLKKVCFIGDNKQLPPFGADINKDLKSVFEYPHLLQDHIFLNTQYRMPTPLGNFISKHVYEGLLLSCHLSVSLGCCQFVDVAGIEAPDEKSWTNIEEVKAGIRIAKQLSLAGKKYKIITPYKGQKSGFEEHLRKMGLDFSNICYSVDSFQGNEEDFIIISLVRTKQLGFLQDIRRTNVMLTRAKKGLIICSSRPFIEGMAATTLIGKLAKNWPSNPWVKADNIEILF